MTSGPNAPGLARSETPAVKVIGVGLWLPGYPSLAHWESGSRTLADAPPSGEALGRIHRRRAGPLGRALCDASSEALRRALVDPSSVASVIGSSIGEAETLVRLLDQMWRGVEPVSPADFTMSVHNAAAGVMSIAWGNRGFTTSLAADYDTPASALLEGIGLVEELESPVLVACADECAPRTLLRSSEAWDMVAGAIVIAPRAWSGPCVAQMGLLWPSDAREHELESAPLEPGVARNPQAGLIDLIDAIRRGATGIVRLDRGEGRGYQARLEREDAR